MNALKVRKCESMHCYPHLCDTLHLAPLYDGFNCGHLEEA